MLAYLENLILPGNDQKYITCPQCRKKLDVADCCKLAKRCDPDFDCLKVQKIMQKRCLKDEMKLFECPKCDAILFHPPQNETRFRCTQCVSNHEMLGEKGAAVVEEPQSYCWRCKLPWRNPYSMFLKVGPDVCGNPGCGNNEMRIEESVKILQSCGSKTIDGFENVPEFRACPNCATVIGHNEYCKHMTCGRDGHVGEWVAKSGCGHEFCFICLKDYYDHENAIHTGCSVAPAQTKESLKDANDSWTRDMAPEYVPDITNDDNKYVFVDTLQETIDYYNGLRHDILPGVDHDQSDDEEETDNDTEIDRLVLDDSDEGDSPEEEREFSLESESVPPINDNGSTTRLSTTEDAMDG